MVVYGVYGGQERVAWVPSKICMSSSPSFLLVCVNKTVGDEITILGNFSEMNKFPAAIDYLDSGKARVEAIVNRVFRIEKWEECLEAMRNESAIKAAIVFSLFTGMDMVTMALLASN